jgi:ATP/ADP translocase
LTFVDIRTGEAPLVGWVLLYTFCATSTDSLVNAAVYALFLGRFDAQRLPYVYIGVSIGSVLIAALYLHLSQRYRLAQLLLGQHLLVWLTLVAYRTGLALSDAPWLIFSLPIWYGVINVLLYLAFWNLVGRLFNLQQGKRLFGLLGAGQQAASLIAGLLVPPLVAGIGVANLLGVAALAGGGAIIFLALLARQQPGLHEPEVAATNQSDEPVTSPLLSDTYVRLIFGLFALFTLGSYFVDTLFYNRLAQQYADKTQVASFLGLFNGVNAGLSLLTQLFIANRLLRRYGVRMAVILTPLLLLVGTLIFVGMGRAFGLTPVHFWLAAGMYLTLLVMNDTDNTAANLLYQPLPAALRLRTQTVVDGILSPSAVGVAGVLLLLLTNWLHFDALQLATALLPILAGWVFVGRWLGHVYGVRVQQALRQRTIQAGERFQPDRASRELLEQTLTHPHPGAALYALDVLSAHDPAALTHWLPHLLHHPSPVVQLEVLARLEQTGDSSALPVIIDCWQSTPEPTVRSAALQTVAALGGLAEVADLDTYLTATDRQMRRGAMIGLLRSGDLAAILAVGETLARLTNSPQIAERIFAADVLGESKVAGFYRPLLHMLAAPHPLVRQAALHAAGKLQHPKLWSSVVAALAVPQTRAAARAALLAGGPPLLPMLQQAVTMAEAEGSDPHLRGEVVRLCGRLPGELAREFLWANVEHPTLALRTQALQALYQRGEQAEPNAYPRIEQQIRAEIAHAVWLLAGLTELDDRPEHAPLRSALVSSGEQARLRLFWWLALRYGVSSMARLRDGFGVVAGSRRQLAGEQRAYLLEALELTVAKPLAALLAPLLDELTPAEQRARLAGEFPQPVLSSTQRLSAIFSGDPRWADRWLRAVALYTAIITAVATEERALWQAAIQAASATDDDLLRETTAWALATLNK